jgi:hypothetical protein
MKDAALPPPLSRRIRLDQLDANLTGEVDASRPELDAVAVLLDLRALDRLSLSYRLQRGGGGRVHLSGRL